MPKFEYLYFMVGKTAIFRMIFPLIYIHEMKMYCVCAYSHKPRSGALLKKIWMLTINEAQLFNEPITSYYNTHSIPFIARISENFHFAKLL